MELGHWKPTKTHRRWKRIMIKIVHQFIPLPLVLQSKHAQCFTLQLYMVGPTIQQDMLKFYSIMLHKTCFQQWVTQEKRKGKCKLTAVTTVIHVNCGENPVRRKRNTNVSVAQLRYHSGVTRCLAHLAAVNSLAYLNVFCSPLDY